MTITQLQKKANKTPKYALKLDGLNLFVSDKQELTGCNLTDKVKQARKFSIGFDNEQIKSKAWTSAVQIQCNNKDMQFKAVKL